MLSPALQVFVAILIGAGIAIAAILAHRRAARAEIVRAALDRSLKSATSLAELAAAISRATTSQQVIVQALAELLHALNANAGAVVIAEPDGSLSVAHAVGHERSLDARSLRMDAASKTPIADAIRRRELVVFESRSDRTREFPDVPADDFLAAFDAAAIIPLAVGQRTLGVAALSFSEPRAFDGDERVWMLAAGRHVAQALARAWLYDRAEQARAEGDAFRVRADAQLVESERAEEALRASEGQYRALAGRMSRLYELSAALSEAITLDAVAKVIVGRGRVVVGASAGSVVLLVDGGSHFETLYAEEYTRTVVEAWHRFQADQGLCSTAAAETREPVFVASLADWQKRYPRSAALAMDGGYMSVAALPLLAEGVVLGVLSFHFTAPINFTDDYVALVKSVAQHCAQALDRARLYELAQRARSDAESANRAKDDFLSTVSHELRTPLTAMLGWASMLRSGKLDPERTARGIDAIFTNATRQAQLIEDLLDVSRIVAGRAALDMEEIDVADSLRAAVDAIMPLAESKHLQLRLDHVPTVSVMADRRRLEQVFLNLMSNAVKFTPPDGRVTVDADITSEWVDIHIADTGIGIEPAFLPHMFERFRQADSSTSRRVGGLGLGLFIARHLIEAQGGSISVDSEGTGLGSVFTVRLPTSDVFQTRSRALAVARPIGEMRSASGPELKGVRVLVVDDEPDSREVIASALESRGASVTAASSAADALESLRTAKFDVLLADIAMPGKDGYELIREIRRSSGTRLARIPAAAVTAFASDDDRQRALDAGFQKHLSKPLPEAALAQAVADLAGADLAGADLAGQLSV